MSKSPVPGAPRFEIMEVETPSSSKSTSPSGKSLPQRPRDIESSRQDGEQHQSPYILSDGEQFVLFGDSLIQGCFSPQLSFSFGAALSDLYTRKLDVINRGLSGYNTLQALRAVPLCLPDPKEAKMRFALIMFGANDARIPDTPGGPEQSISLSDYTKNLRHLVNHPTVKSHDACHIILVTPPPIDERKCLLADREKYPDLGRVLRRTCVNTARYAQAVRDLGAEMSLPVLDIHTAMLAHCGYSRDTAHLAGAIDAPANANLQALLADGLHFSGDGYRLLFFELMTLIERTWPDQMPSRLPGRLPAWDYQPAWKKEAKVDGEKGDAVGPDWEDGSGYVVTGRFQGTLSEVRKMTRGVQ